MSDSRFLPVKIEQFLGDKPLELQINWKHIHQRMRDFLESLSISHWNRYQ